MTTSALHGPLALLLIAAAVDPVPAAGQASVEWPGYGNDPGGARHSPARQITPANVAKLKKAWSFATKDLYTPERGRSSALETTPIYADGVLYLTSAIGRVIAIDPETAAEKWTYDPKVNVQAGWGDFTNRGVSLHRKNGRSRIIGVTQDGRLYALEAKTGERLWEIDLRKGLRLPPKDFSEYQQTSPPCVIGDVIVAGSSVADNGRTNMPSGEVRGFDVESGRQLWSWDPVPEAASLGAKAPGGANAWSIIVADPKRGVVYVPTGSASPDYYGGMRLGKDHGNSLVALEAKTGKMLWAFQTVRHDLWDYDVAAPPALLRVKGKDAVAVGSKSGFLYILDRDTGRPLHRVEDRPVPKSDADGETASPTQPYPVVTKSLSPHDFKPWGPTEDARKWCEETIAKLRYDGAFTPPSVRGSLVYPGNIGGIHWGGMTYDAASNLLVVPTNNLAATVRLIPNADFEVQRKSDRLGLEFARQAGTPFGMARQFLLSPAGTPCTTPPWGLLAAVDVNTGQLKWQVPLGEFGGQKGAPNLGGPISTATGLTFIGATFDPHIRAFDSKTGAELWKAQLPASARSTPMTYVHKGKQYVVISAGGHDKRFGPLGDQVVAFALE